MTEDEKFYTMIDSVARSAAQLSARMALALKAGLSPNRVEVWIKQTHLPNPESAPISEHMAKMILEIAAREVVAAQAMEDKL
jgi:hypothetical protein